MMMHLLRRGMVVLVLSMAWLAVPAAEAWQVNEELAKAYLKEWGSRERSATTPDLRRRLAVDLLEAAKKPDVSKEMAVQLCLRSHYFGTRDAFSDSARPGYATAAKALEHMKDADPTMTQQALDRVRDIYKAAYESDPATKLGFGIGFSDATMQAADRRLVEMEHAVARGELTLTQMSTQVNRINREYLSAHRTADTVLNRAQRRAVQAKQRKNERLFGTLTKFIDDNKPLLEQLKAAAAETEPVINRLKQVKIDISRFERSPSRTTAERIIAFYLYELDSPALALPYATEYMKKEDLRLVELAASGDTRLEPKQALLVGEWYLAQVEDATSDEHVEVMLLRARRYFALCSGKFFSDDDQYDRANKGMNAVNESLSERDIKRAKIPVIAKKKPKPVVVEPEEPEEPIENSEVDEPVEEVDEEIEAIIEQIEEEDAGSRFQRRDDRFQEAPRRGNIFDF